MSAIDHLLARSVPLLPRRLRENPGLARSVARGTLARLVGRD